MPSKPKFVLLSRGHQYSEQGVVSLFPTRKRANTKKESLQARGVKGLTVHPADLVLRTAQGPATTTVHPD